MTARGGLERATLEAVRIATPNFEVVASKLALYRREATYTCKPPTTGLSLPKTASRSNTAMGSFEVPDNPIIPFIEGDGTGRDIWKASQRVFDAAVEKAYGGKRAIKWFEIFAGEKAFRQFSTWLPDDSVAAARDLRVSIKGPLTTPVGGGIRSLNVALRQLLDLYACVRPVKYYQGVPSPVKHPEKVDIVIFRENTEDVYSGIEFKEGSADAARLIAFINDDPAQGRQEKNPPRLRRGHQAHLHLRHQAAGALPPSSAIETGRKTVTLVHKGNIQKFTEGAFREWGYEVAMRGVPRADRHRARELDPGQSSTPTPASPSRRTRRSSSRASNSATRLSATSLRRDQGRARLDRQDARQRRVEAEDSGQRPHRRLHLPADHHPAGGLLRFWPRPI